jgi:hypothetical protein
VTVATVYGEELFALFLAALEAVVPEVTSEQRALLRDVVDGMLREQVQTPSE